MTRHIIGVKGNITITVLDKSLENGLTFCTIDVNIFLSSLGRRLRAEIDEIYPEVLCKTQPHRFSIAVYKKLSSSLLLCLLRLRQSIFLEVLKKMRKNWRHNLGTTQSPERGLLTFFEGALKSRVYRNSNTVIKGTVTFTRALRRGREKPSVRPPRRHR